MLFELAYDGGLYPKLCKLMKLNEFLFIELSSAIFELMVLISFGSESVKLLLIAIFNNESVLLSELSFIFI